MGNMRQADRAVRVLYIECRVCHQPFAVDYQPERGPSTSVCEGCQVELEDEFRRDNPDAYHGVRRWGSQ